MVRTSAKQRMAFLVEVQLMLCVREKGTMKDPRNSYLEPTLVPLGEKPQVGGS